MSNPYINQDGILINKLGITDKDTLKQVEYDITSQKQREILEGSALSNIKNFGFERQQAIHKYLFEDIYEWAGKTRTVPYSKNMTNGLTTVFAQPNMIEQKWKKLEQKTELFANAKDLEFEQKVEQLTDIFIYANHLHPFPEGNGRSLQVFMQQLAKEQNIHLDYTNKSILANWNEASGLSALHGKVEIDPKDGRKFMVALPPNREPIRQIFKKISSPITATEAVKQEQPKKGNLTAEQLKTVYRKMAEIQIQKGGTVKVLKPVEQQKVQAKTETVQPQQERKQPKPKI